MPAVSLVSLLQLHCHHRDLHSFPTRRSSDLLRVSIVAAIAAVILLLVILELIRSRRLQERYALLWLLTRSEEHTSELLSLTNLVCRLLLEKKKKKSTRDLPTRDNPTQYTLVC